MFWKTTGIFCNFKMVTSWKHGLFINIVRFTFVFWQIQILPGWQRNVSLYVPNSSICIIHLSSNPLYNPLCIIHLIHLFYAVVFTGFCVGGGGREQWGGSSFFIGEIKNFAFFKLENFQKMLKNQWKFYNFLKNFKEILRFFENFWKS